MSKKMILHENLFDLNSYDYNLPQENIAQSPANPRDSSRLLVWDCDSEEIDFNNKFHDIKKFFRSGDLLVLNDTKVIPARLNGYRKSGGKTEVFLLKPLNKNFLKWEALVKPARKIHKDSIIIISGKNFIVEDEKSEGIKLVKFQDFLSKNEVMKFLEENGNVPLPPYIKNKEDMRESYQTIFAVNEGSVAAPTASLHFTQELLDEIKSIGVKISWVTLHVGLGTFRPVKSFDIRKHVIHTEHCELPEETKIAIHECRKNKGRVFASGTTAARTLESFASEKILGEVNSGVLDTDLYIYPGFKFKIIDALITNFHLPKSSLIMLVSAFVAFKSNNNESKEEKSLMKLLDVYEKAIKDGWRFFSFGDAMLIK